MSPRRRNDDNATGPEPQAAPRVRGAWKTPAVVVRAPDGSVVGGAARPSRPSGRASKIAAPSVRPPRSTPQRRPVPPPGVPGGVLASPSLAVGPRRRSAPGGADRNGHGSRGPQAKATAKRSSLPQARRTSNRRLVRRRLLQAVSSLRLDRLAPVDHEARERRNARLRWLGTRVGSVALSGLLVYAVFPVRTYLNQRSETNRAREQLEVLREANERLEQRADELRDPETVEETARRDYNLVMPGEEPYTILPAPEQAPEADTPSEPGG
jgi:cell division protein FtsB